MLSVSTVTTAWRVVGLRMEGSCEYSPLNKQSRTTDSGWSSSLGVGRGANNSPPTNKKTQRLLRNTTHSLEPRRIICHNLSIGNWALDLS
jgi:hypothetical protein